MSMTDPDDELYMDSELNQRPRYHDFDDMDIFDEVMGWGYLYDDYDEFPGMGLED